jgi:hypothetical protein
MLTKPLTNFSFGGGESGKKKAPAGSIVGGEPGKKKSGSEAVQKGSF